MAVLYDIETRRRMGRLHWSFPWAHGFMKAAQGIRQRCKRIRTVVFGTGKVRAFVQAGAIPAPKVSVANQPMHPLLFVAAGVIYFGGVAVALVYSAANMLAGEPGQMILVLFCSICLIGGYCKARKIQTTGW